jgi:NAD(P)-dependent dehydrogenase (short-subunit alcohol dehydrogenase family)
MQEFRGKVAVVTGAASGMGRAFAERFAREGMRVVLADVEQTALQRAVDELRAAGHEVRGVVTDVSKPDAVENLAHEALAAFGKIHVVCNNAGVNGGRGHTRSILSDPPAIWEASIQDWQWITGVNYFGVAHGIHTFVPIMLRQNEEGHVVNTASMAGITPGNNVYGATKHAVVSMSESLYRDLRRYGSQIGVTCLCPTLVASNFYHAERNRPSNLSEDAGALSAGDLNRMRDAFSKGWAPAEVAERVLQAVRANQLYLVVGRPSDDERIRARLENILNRRNPADATLATAAAGAR